MDRICNCGKGILPKVPTSYASIYMCKRCESIQIYGYKKRKAK